MLVVRWDKKYVLLLKCAGWLAEHPAGLTHIWNVVISRENVHVHAFWLFNCSQGDIKKDMKHSKTRGKRCSAFCLLLAFTYSKREPTVGKSSSRKFLVFCSLSWWLHLWSVLYRGTSFSFPAAQFPYRNGCSLSYCLWTFRIILGKFHNYTWLKSN